MSIFQKAIDTYGAANQEELCVEECAELIVAIKHSQRDDRNETIEHDEKHIDGIITELADVAIMIEQMKIIYGIDKFNCEYQRKIRRLEERLKCIG